MKPPCETGIAQERRDQRGAGRTFQHVGLEQMAHAIPSDTNLSQAWEQSQEPAMSTPADHIQVGFIRQDDHFT